jgi:hypothetical protein
MKLKIIVGASATLIGIISLRAQNSATDPVLTWMNQIAQQELAERDKAMAQIQTKSLSVNKDSLAPTDHGRGQSQ